MYVSCVFSFSLELNSFLYYYLSHCKLEMEYVDNDNSGIKTHTKEFTMFFEVKL